MRKWLIFVLAALISASPAWAAWKWVDDKGVVHYSDLPHPGAEEVQLPGADAVAAARAARAARAASQTSAADPSSAPQGGSSGYYRVFNIVSPTQQQTFWNIGAMLNVQLDIQPALRPGDRINVIYDGEQRDVGATSPEFTLSDVYRGIHTMHAEIVDSAGNEVLKSAAITFMVQQTSILNPNNPQARNPGNTPVPRNSGN